jgi:hypothetical protein
LHAQLVQASTKIWIETQSGLQFVDCLSRIAQLCGLEAARYASAAAFGADDKRGIYHGSFVARNGLRLKLIITLNVRGMFERAVRAIGCALEAILRSALIHSLFRILFRHQQ